MLRLVVLETPRVAKEELLRLPVDIVRPDIDEDFPNELDGRDDFMALLREDEARFPPDLLKPL